MYRQTNSYSSIKIALEESSTFLVVPARAYDGSNKPKHCPCPPPAQWGCARTNSHMDITYGGGGWGRGGDKTRQSYVDLRRDQVGLRRPLYLKVCTVDLICEV